MNLEFGFWYTGPGTPDFLKRGKTHMKVTEISITSWQKIKPVRPRYPDILIYILLGITEVVTACVRAKTLG